MKSVVSFLIGTSLWVAWVMVANAAGLKGPLSWVLWGVTVLIGIWYGNQHRFFGRG